jgi:hypothetical protein
MLWQIVDFQYKVSEVVVKYISDTVLPYYPNLEELYPVFFDISKTLEILFVMTFILSFLSFLLWRLLWRLFKFQAYDAEKFRIILFFNIFYIVPFVYWFIWGRFNIINIFLLFLGSGAYFAFEWVISNPDAVIDYFTEIRFIAQEDVQ